MCLDQHVCVFLFWVCLEAHLLCPNGAAGVILNANMASRPEAPAGSDPEPDLGC